MFDNTSEFGITMSSLWAAVADYILSCHLYQPFWKKLKSRKYAMIAAMHQIVIVFLFASLNRK